MEEILHFKVSSGLKNIIGRELINDKFIAIFELVKNSYDARASKVAIEFRDLDTTKASITIRDDGIGMTKEDVINKWLFVAYSEKSNPSYRDKIKRAVAGAKGVGRFSCDRLGEEVVLETNTNGERSKHLISIRWSDFEKSSLDNFTDIDVYYRTKPSDLATHGTSIVISELRESWTRTDLLALKKALAQMVNPAATKDYDSFEIELYVPSEITADSNEKEERNRVNGAVFNNAFEILDLKTTRITVNISPDGKSVSTELNDRGTYLFRTVEKNEFSLRDISCRLFFLNRAAKVNFTRIMGVEAIKYGSIFVYRNDFRVYPYGEPGRDFFDIDLRKQQGYKRFLGTRELIGQIGINGNHNNLVETSSRNNGFINSRHLEELKLFFMEYVLKPLEKYVVNIVQWGDTESFLESAKSKTAFGDLPGIVRRIKSRTKEDAYLSIEYNQDLPMIISEYESTAIKAARELRELASRTKNDEILRKAESVQRHTQSLEKLAREVGTDAQKKQDQLEKVSDELSIAKKQISVLAARANLTAEQAIGAMHIMKGYADAIDSTIAEVFELTADSDIASLEISPLLWDIRQICDKIKYSYNLVMLTNYSADSDIMQDDIVVFIEEYMTKLSHPLLISLSNPDDLHVKVKFNPLELSIVLDNAVRNSVKANASNFLITIVREDNWIVLHCADDGYGLNPSADPQSLFLPGYRTTDGSGIGLSTIKKYMEKVGGKVVYNHDFKEGFEILLYLRQLQ